MKHSIMLILVSALSVTGAFAQEPPVTVTRLTETLHLLSTDQGEYTTNTLAMVGNDGILLVDTQARKDAEDLKKAVDAFGLGLPRYIINTHRHVEHVGGNAIFGEAPIVIAHALVPEKLRSGSYLFDEFPSATLPDITVADSLTLRFNGEHIRIIALPGGHDDNELIVHFVESKVVHLSSLVNGFNFPSVDSDGDVLAFASLISRAMRLLPDDVLIVSGHNDTGRWKDLLAYREMLVQTTETVRRLLEEGKDLSQLQEEHVLDAWESYAGSYVSTDEWIEYLVKGLEDSDEPGQTVYEPLYYTWKEGGAEAAVTRYRELKRDHAGEYRFDEFTLLMIGIKVLGNDHAAAAATFLRASLQDYPDSDYGYYANYQLAKAEEDLGQRESAIGHCRRALELNPEFEAAAALLEQLKAQ